MNGRFQPTTVGNMVKCDDGGYVCFWDYKQLKAENAALREQLVAANRQLRQQAEAVASTINRHHTELAAAQKDAIAWEVDGSITVREDYVQMFNWKGAMVGTGRAIPFAWKPVLWASAIEKEVGKC